MKNYTKPTLVENETVVLEGVYASSGTSNSITCPYNRRNFNPGAGQCQGCVGVYEGPDRAGQAALKFCPANLSRK